MLVVMLCFCLHERCSTSRRPPRLPCAAGHPALMLFSWVCAPACCSCSAGCAPACCSACCSAGCAPRAVQPGVLLFSRVCACLLPAPACRLLLFSQVCAPACCPACAPAWVCMCAPHVWPVPFDLRTRHACRTSVRASRLAGPEAALHGLTFCPQHGLTFCPDAAPSLCVRVRVCVYVPMRACLLSLRAG